MSEAEKIKDRMFVAFDAICDFADDLNHTYGNTKDELSLALYARLLTQITTRHKSAIIEHCNIFTKWCQENDAAIKAQSIEGLVNKRISYKENIYIDVAKYLQKAETEERKAIWGHLLKIYAMVDPSSEAREMIRTLREQHPSGKESEVIGNMLEKITKSVDLKTAQTDPMAAISTILKDGTFNNIFKDIQEGVESGNLNLGNMLSTMTSLLGQNGMPPEMLTQMAGSMNQMTQMMQQQNPEAKK